MRSKRDRAVRSTIDIADAILSFGVFGAELVVCTPSGTKVIDLHTKRTTFFFPINKSDPKSHISAVILDSSLLIADSACTVHVLSRVGNRFVFDTVVPIDSEIIALAATDCSVAVARADGKLSWIDVSDGTCILSDQKTSISHHPSMCITSIQSVLGITAIGYSDGLVKLLKGKNQLVLELQLHGRAVMGLAFDKPGNFLASVSEDGVLNVVDLKIMTSGGGEMRGQAGLVRSCVVSGSGLTGVAFASARDIAVVAMELQEILFIEN